MTEALKKVSVPLSERYETKCCECQWDRHFFGTKEEARASAVKMGWEFRKVALDIDEFSVKVANGQAYFLRQNVELAYCPHCKLLKKEPS